MIPPIRFDIFPPDWGMLRRSRRVLIFLQTKTENVSNSTTAEESSCSYEAFESVHKKLIFIGTAWLGLPSQCKLQIPSQPKSFKTERDKHFLSPFCSNNSSASPSLPYLIGGASCTLGCSGMDHAEERTTSTAFLFYSRVCVPCSWTILLINFIPGYIFSGIMGDIPAGRHRERVMGESHEAAER